MENEIKEKINAYVVLLDTIKEQTGNNPEALGILHEMMKDIRAEKMQRKRKSYSESGLATEKQLEYLKALGIEVAEKLTKQDASELIEQAKQSKYGVRHGYKSMPLQISA